MIYALSRSGTPRGYARMTAQLIDGAAVAAAVRAEVKAEVAALKARHGAVPGLVAVLVGEDQASQVYVGSKEKQAAETGMFSRVDRLPATTTQGELLAKVAELNADDRVDGILVQLPLPSHIDADTIIDAIDPAKDVDGFHPVNVGRLSGGREALVPCTPLGSMILLNTVHPSLAGLPAVVIGRSNIVGKPMAQLLLQANATVTIAHSRTRDLPSVVRSADIVVAAVGRPHFVKADWLKPGATVIDVGINRLDTGKLVGDVDTEAAKAVAGALTPVPKGVGPMTIACLMKNTLTAARARRGWR